MTTIKVNQQISTAEVIATFAQITTTATRYAQQKTAQAVRTACDLMKTARHWLNSKHDLLGDDCDPVIATGWQYIGIGTLVTVVCFVLSIKF